MTSVRQTPAGYDAPELGHTDADPRASSNRLDTHLQPVSQLTASQTSLEKAEQGENPKGSPCNCDTEQARPFHSGLPELGRPANSRSTTWDLLSGIKKWRHPHADFDSRNATEGHLADSDIPQNKVSKRYNYYHLNVSTITRWIFIIFPILGALWIPGILGITRFPNATVWGVKLLWWSIWLTVVWAGWWAALATAWILPGIIRATVGVVAVSTRRYIGWIAALHRYIALFSWTLVVWIGWLSLIDGRKVSNSSPHTTSILHFIGKLLFTFYLCTSLLLFEKFSIQWIAGKFHERSYAERIADQKFAVRSLATLYRYSVDNPGRSDELRPHTFEKDTTIIPNRILKNAMKRMRSAASTTTTVLGNVTSEITGSSVLQPNSPQAIVKTALESVNKSRLLARRLFYSFAKPGVDHVVVEDIAKFFPEDADVVFALFDKDSNGDITRDEFEMACMDFHREQLSLEHSMQDLDSAVGRLDNILMTIYVFVVIIILAVALDTQLATLITGAGALILGLSWLIGGSLQEVLISIIFLFIKHPFDVGDRINLNQSDYTVKEIRLLTSIFLDSNGTLVQVPNTVLNTMFIQNMRRSPQMSEKFTFEVNYSTTFPQLEALRQKMIMFLKSERRDFQPSFDVAVVDFPGQRKMTLTSDIKYKSNWQQGALKAQRRNKWICALKLALAEVKIFGPDGDPDAKPDPKRYTIVPWEQVQAEEHKAEEALATEPSPSGPGWNLTDKNAVILDDSRDVFGEADELHMTHPRKFPEHPLIHGTVQMPIPDPTINTAPTPETTKMATMPR